jgi:amino acid adenylation domain-containing protein
LCAVRKHSQDEPGWGIDVGKTMSSETCFYQSALDPIERIQVMAQWQPYKVAIESHGIQLSYQQLLRALTLRASEIAQLGVKAGDHVGVVAPNSVDTIITFLSLWRIGAVYVPLNPELPAARLVMQADLAKLAVIIECQALERHENARAVAVDWPKDLSTPIAKGILTYQADCIDHTNDLELEPSSWPDVLAAYIIFTSGTTGSPKPVLVSRKNCMAHTRGFCSLIGLTHEARVMHICASSFDVSIEEIIPTMCQGSSLVIAPTNAKGSPSVLDAFIRSSAVTVINLPTALWSMWMDFLQNQQLSVSATTQTVLIGGESCPPHRAQQWLEIADHKVRCINAYGPTETTITVSGWVLSKRPPEELTVPVPVGLSLRDVGFSIVDYAESNGVGAGELIIYGDSVSHGYYGHPRATAEKFLPNPNRWQPGDRCYRSGDVAYHLANNDIILVGRYDRQVKIRGHRIELDEIETVLLYSPVIKYACVEHLIESAGVHSRELLIAYVVPHDDAVDIERGKFFRADEEDFCSSLEHELSDTLPRYMRPLFYCLLDALPLTANGKIDRAGLPKYSSLSANSLLKSAAAEGELNEVEACFISVLGFLSSDRSATFLQLGGDSISAMNFSSRLWRIGYDLDVAQILSQAPILPQLESLKKRRPELSERPFDMVSSDKLINDQCRQVQQSGGGKYQYVAPCSDAQKAMLYASLMSQKNGRFIEQVEGAIGAVDLALFKKAWRAVIMEHDALRSSFDLAIEGLPLQVIHAEVGFTIRRQVLSEQEDCAFDVFLTQFLSADRARSFDLVSAPLFRLVIIERADNTAHLVWTYHHCILDGWSDVRVLDQVFEHYASLSKQNTLALSAPKADYREFLYWYDNQASEAGDSAWLDYIGAGHKLPSLSQRDAITGPESLSRYYLGPEQIANINALSKAASVTVNTVVDFAFGLALANYLGTTDVVIGAVNALRPREVDNIECLVGPLLTLKPLRIRFSDTELLTHSLANLASELLIMSAFPRVPYLHLMSSLTDQPHQELFDAIIVFENYPPAENSVVNGLESHTRTNYPLNIIVWPNQGFIIEVRFTPSVIDQYKVDAVVNSFLKTLSVMSPVQCINDLLEQIEADTDNDNDSSNSENDPTIELSF